MTRHVLWRFKSRSSIWKKIYYVGFVLFFYWQRFRLSTTEWKSSQFWTGLEANPLLLIWNIQFSRDGFEDLIHRRLRTVGVLISFWKIEKNTKLFFEKMRQFWFLDMLVKMRHFHYETFWLRWDNFVIRHFCYETFLVVRHF